MRKFLFPLFFIIVCKFASAQDTITLINGRKIIVSSVDLQSNTIAYRGIEKGSKLKTIDPYRVFSISYKNGTERIVYSPDSLDPLDFKVDEMRNFIYGEQDATELYKNTLIKVLGAGIGAGAGFLGFYGLIVPPLYSTIIGSHSPNVDNKLTFEVSGNATDVLGIPSGKYLNEISGKNNSPVIKKDQELKVANKKFRFNQDTGLDSTVALINENFKCVRVHAVNDNGKIKLYKSNSTARISDSAYREGFGKKVRDYKIRNGMIYALIGFIAGSITYGLVFN